MSEKQAREALMLDQLARDGVLTVSGLAKQLGVSEVTIRTSLRELEGRGLLVRTHGGAQPSTFQSVLERNRHHLAEKERIAAAAGGLVRDRDSLMIEAGTTTALVMKALAGRQSVQVVTNSTLAIPAARLNDAVRLVMTGGRFHHESESLIGSPVFTTINTYNARLAFVGTDGFSIERGMTTHFAEGADAIRAMHARADETWLLADSSKFGRSGFVSVLPLSELTGLITDTGLAEDDVATLRELGLRVLVV